MQALTPSQARLVVLVVLLVVSLTPAAACAAAPAPTPAVGPPPTARPITVITAPQRGPDTPVPAPGGPVVITISGRIGQTNGGGTLRLDQALLDELGRVQVTVFEPWVKSELQFQGAWLEDVLQIAQPDGAAQTVHLTALDDYQIDLNMADIRAGGILLATRTGDGAAIPIEDGGPVRVVFMAGVPAAASPDQWIWSVAGIDLR